MHLLALHHVNIRTTRLDAMRRWYVDVLGLVDGFRPYFGFPGAWLYIGDHPALHLASTADVDDGHRPRLEHFALEAAGLEEFQARLELAGERFERRTVEEIGVTQINLWDPDGNHIHVDFHKA
jgi:catechol 2,3-dioxygenase-like lactoylglutathione lyase family enzyme